MGGVRGLTLRRIAERRGWCLSVGSIYGICPRQPKRPTISCSCGIEYEITQGYWSDVHMSPELILPQFLVYMLDLEFLHLFGIRREIHLVTIIRSTIYVVVDSLIVRSELG